MIDRNLIESWKWHQTSREEALETLQVDSEAGLSRSQVNERLTTFGPNEIIDQGGKSIWKILWAQLTDTMVLVLFAAAIISIIVGDLKDAIAITAIVLINAVIGLVQEYRAEQAMAALKQMASPNVRVRRNGKPEEIDAKLLVPGDIIFLEAGSKVALRTLDAAKLSSKRYVSPGEVLPGSTVPINQIPLLIRDGNCDGATMALACRSINSLSSLLWRILT